jgi:uncharacterized protein
MNFTPLTLSDFQTHKAFFNHQPYELCPYLLSSMIAWRSDNSEVFKTTLGDDLIIKGRIKDLWFLYLPISPMDHYPPRKLRDLLEAAGVDTVFPVPDQYIKHHGEEQVASFFSIEEKPKHSDYVYRMEDLAQLKGNSYSKKRNLINQFERKYLKDGRVEVNPVTPEDADECIDFLEEWCLARNCHAEDMEELACEKEAAKFTLKNQRSLEVNGLMLRLDGEVCAFGIGTWLTETMGVLNYEKAFSDIKGLYQYFDRECARRLFPGFQYINKENDMGEPGLQKAKKSYYPARMVSAYELTVR